FIDHAFTQEPGETIDIAYPAVAGSQKRFCACPNLICESDHAITQLRPRLDLAHKLQGSRVTAYDQHVAQVAVMPPHATQHGAQHQTAEYGQSTADTEEVHHKQRVHHVDVEHRARHSQEGGSHKGGLDYVAHFRHPAG